MKRKLLIVLGIAIGIYFVSTIQFNNTKEVASTKKIKKLHKENLDKSPFKEQMQYSKKERIANGLPPNMYNEQMWELSMNPQLGRPTPSVVAELQQQLREQRANDLINGRVPGDAMDNGWLERGPNNVGGRTRAIMFDPNDATNETVFAGGVSGGLWKNTNISNVNSQWVRVGIDENLTVSSIKADPNDSMTFYVGTGESYVGHTDGAANGDGIWKSTDGGTTWTNVFGGNTGVSYFVSASNITVNSPAGIAGDYISVENNPDNFGVEITGTITADFVMANDPNPTGNETPDLGCNAFGPDATGKIAIIRRGECSFVSKVKNAQDVGAIGAIIMNNVNGGPVPMGGNDTTITIPTVMISNVDGDAIEAAMALGTVNGSLNPATGNITGMIVPGVQHINDIVIKNNGGTSEIYVAAGDALYSNSNVTTYVGALSYGMYKSTDNGSTWAMLNLPLTSNGNRHNPNDIEIGADGTIWVATTVSHTYSSVDGNGGGKVFKSTDGGATFTEDNLSVTNGQRTQIAVSATNANKIYVLAELSTGGVIIRKKTSPISIADLPLPNDADSGITAADFTRGQAFYDLVIEVDPTNDDIVYTGGIDLFKSTNSGGIWTQFSHWYGGFGFQEVHGDQHAIAFGNGDASKVVFGNDGGVYYSANGGTTTQARNNGYNTSQFYTVGVAPTTAFTGDYFAGGLQDNGTQLFQNASQAGPDSTTEPYGGDGAYTFFDQDGTDQYFIRNYVFNSGISLYNFAGTNVTIENEGSNNGSFINPQALDSNLDILYSNYSAGSNFIVRRYSGIKSSGTLTKTSLTDEALTTRPTAFTVSPYTTTSSKLLVGTVLGDVLLVENANASPTWTGLDGNLLVGSVSDIEFGQNENEIFVTMHNYGVNNVWYTSDQGANWEAKDGNLPDLPVKTILQNPLNLEEVLIGTELGVWYTNNFSSASPTWNQAYNGMSNVKVLDLDVRDDNMVFAATHGRGVFSGQFTSESLSVEESILANGINMYPTVSNGEFTIKSTQDFGNVELNIFNISGQKVYSSELKLSNNTQQVNLSLASGMYLAQFTVDNIAETKKIIIE